VSSPSLTTAERALAVNGGHPVRTKPYPTWPSYGPEERAAADAVLSFFQRFPGGSASGDPEVIEAVRHLHFRF